MEEYLPLLVWPSVGRQGEEWQVISGPLNMFMLYCNGDAHLIAISAT